MASHGIPIAPGTGENAEADRGHGDSSRSGKPTAGDGIGTPRVASIENVEGGGNCNLFESVLRE